ncbi:MAG: M1 family metallopeptidase [Bacteroidota bacterium]
MKKRFFVLICCFSGGLYAQPFTHQDTLRGSITAERVWWDLVHYHLDIEVKPEEKFLSGQNTISYRVLEAHDVLQIDLQKPLKIQSVIQDGETLSVRSDGNAHFVQLKKEQAKGSLQQLVVTYEGKPREAVRAPWDGGVSWKKDRDGNHFIATSCQGLGASVWWPCKDHMYDEVDSMHISVEVPENLADVSNGRLLRVVRNREKKTKTFHWYVANPINNYGVNINIAPYVKWQEKYQGEKGKLDLTYWVLPENKKKAKKHFKEVPRMLAAFEHWFGPYPFYEDGYQLVQTPYLGMEHQSSITYGNQFFNGYRGRDLSETGWGMKFDFIIVHESGHEWFANNITHTDASDIWIHESFTNYSESLFLEYHYGKVAGQEYVRGTRMHIENRLPIIGPYHVNYAIPSSDQYYKGGNILNTLRTLVNDDEKWRQMLRNLNQHFYHQTVKSNELEAYIGKELNLDLTKFFDQYLRDPRLPVFEYYHADGQLHYRWTNCIDGFNMPMLAEINGERKQLSPTSDWKKQSLAALDSLEVEVNLYVGVLKAR